MLFKGAGIISLLISVISCLFLLPEHFVWVPAIFVISFILIILIWALACIIVTRFIDLNKEYNEPNRLYRFFTDCIIQSLHTLMNIKLHVKGEEVLPEEKFLLVSNHKAAMDPLLTMGALSRYNMGFVAKKEIYKIPIIRKLMHACFCLCLDRENIREEAKTIIRAGKLVKEQKASIGIYPEGTRNKEEGLLPFLNGAFKIAKKANCPIVVAVIKNPELISQNAPFKRTHVFLEYINVIDKEFVANHNTAEISDAVRKLMEAHLNI